MGELDGITLSTGEHVFAGLTNSFAEAADKKKWKYIGLIAAILIPLQIGGLIFVSWQGQEHEIPYTSASIDLGEFKPRARKAPVIEVDEVFGNQFVKEKKEATVLPANEAGGSVDGESVVDLDVEGSGSGGGSSPNIQRCAVKNFPPEAKAYVEDALVVVKIIADKTGYIREAKPLFVRFSKTLPPDLKERLKKMFIAAGRASLQGRRCPAYYQGGVAVPWAMEVSLSYELDH